MKAVYNEKDNKLVLKFNCSKEYVLSPDFISNFKEKVLGFLSVKGINVEIDVKNILIDDSQIKIAINKYFQDKYPSVAPIVNLYNLDLKDMSGKYEVSFALDKTVLDVINVNAIENELSEILSNQFLSKFKVNILSNESN